MTERLIAASARGSGGGGAAIEYLQSAQTRKEDLARDIAPARRHPGRIDLRPDVRRALQDL